MFSFFLTICMFVCFSFSFALPFPHTQMHPPLFSVLSSARLTLQIIAQAPLVSGFQFGFDYGEAAAREWRVRGERKKSIYSLLLLPLCSGPHLVAVTVLLRPVCSMAPGLAGL